MYENLEYNDISQLEKPTMLSLHKFAIDYSDAVVQASPNLNSSVVNYIESSEKLFLAYPGDEDYEDKYQILYDKLVEKK